MDYDTLRTAPPSIKIPVSVLSLAICDALGAPAEFHKRGSFPCISTFIQNETFGTPPGTWTDDTSMMLCLAQSFISSEGVCNEADQAKNYIKWYREGYLSATDSCFDIGISSRMALDIWLKSVDGDTQATLEEVRKVLDKPKRCGNGSLMRVLPVALVFWRTPAKAVEYAKRSSKVTHPHELCQEACVVYVYLITTIISKAESRETFSKKDLLKLLTEYPYENQDLKKVFGEGSDIMGKRSSQISSSGYVLHTLEAVLWVFLTTESFEEGAVRAVNLGDDADTVAAIYGGLAGVWYADAMSGEGDEFSEFWSPKVRNFRDGLVKRELVEEVGRGLLDLSDRVGS